MTALTQSVAIGDNQITVDTAFADGSFPGYVKIDSELLAVGGAEWRNSKLLTLSKPATATHNNGATVTYAGNPFDADFLSATGGGGGAIAVDNTVDPPAEVTTLVVPGADVSTPGEANLGTVVTILSRSITLTDAQIKALPTTAVQLVPAPAANQMLGPIAAWLFMDWVADYANIGDSSRIGIGFSGTFTSVLAQFGSSGAPDQVINLLADGASHAAFMGLSAFLSGGATFVHGVGQFHDEPGVLGAALEMYGVNAGSSTGNFTGGDAGNSLTVCVWYGIVTLP